MKETERQSVLWCFGPGALVVVPENVRQLGVEPVKTGLIRSPASTLNTLDRANAPFRHLLGVLPEAEGGLRFYSRQVGKSLMLSLAPERFIGELAVNNTVDPMERTLRALLAEGVYSALNTRGIDDKAEFIGLGVGGRPLAVILRTLVRQGNSVPPQTLAYDLAGSKGGRMDQERFSEWADSRLLKNKTVVLVAPRVTPELVRLVHQAFGAGVNQKLGLRRLFIVGDCEDDNVVKKMNGVVSVRWGVDPAVYIRPEYAGQMNDPNMPVPKLASVGGATQAIADSFLDAIPGTIRSICVPDQAELAIVVSDAMLAIGQRRHGKK